MDKIYPLSLFCSSLVIDWRCSKRKKKQKKNRARKTRALKSFRQMAAATSSGRGGHGHCPTQTAGRTDWSETVAHFLRLSSVSQNDAFQTSRPHVPILSGCWTKLLNLFSACDLQAAAVQTFSITSSAVTPPHPPPTPPHHHTTSSLKYNWGWYATSSVTQAFQSKQ